ncbi:MAG: DarT1-associated NADAR antitoxin family protein [Bacillota bacterium]
MAKRPVFIANVSISGFVEEKEIDFTWFPGLSLSQKQKSIKSLHDAFNKDYPDFKVLEISSKSLETTGVELSAFNLILSHQNKIVSVETAFQSSKVFDLGGPYLDLLNNSAREAKTDERLKSSGKLIYFCFHGQKWSLEPKTAFYDWLYLNAVYHNIELTNKIMEYSAFSDIEFNPKKSINCQARSAALFVSLKRTGLLEKVINKTEEFLKIYSV